ncbi:MAG: B12-binding domain-containing radical SAM protein, partial [Actinomycetia bacterium]|nr:B12-binding domain-containing radical SAM protein [Actinomycetes bacterium]
MKVLLIQPPVGHQIGYDRLARVEPLGLENLAGALSGHEVRLADLRFHDDLDRLLRTFAPDVCGLSCSFTMGVKKTIECARRIKRLKPDTIVLVGGVHPSIAPTDFRDEAVDILAKGEGESLLTELLTALEHGRDPESVRGLYLNSDGHQVFTGRRPLIEDLDSLPFPRRDLSAVPAKTYHFNFWRPLSLVETGRGCPYRCEFCSVWRFYQHTNRHKSAERVVEEIAQAPGRFILFTDDNFLDDMPRTRRIAELLSDKGIEKRYSLQARADAIAANPGLIDAWYDVGLRHIFVGFEAASDQRLAELHKETTLQTTDEAMAVLLRHPDLSVTGSFIVDPGFTAEDFEHLRR